jgi:dTDP-glucose 4,6-dehydratase
MTILVTGGCGFIGSNFIRHFLKKTDETIANLDKLTYAGNLNNLYEFSTDLRYSFINGDIASSNLVNNILNNFKPRAIINFAAESHVDNSIKNSIPFVETNVLGTVKLLECVKEYQLTVNPEVKFIHISTDEVYGSLETLEGSFSEDTKYDPKSPYSASKAASDHFVMAYHNTFGLRAIITNCSNNYGPFQHKEKLVPTVISRAMKNQDIPVYGKGVNIRDWLFVEDHCEAIYEVLERGKIGDKYNIGGNCEVSNMELVRIILKIMNKPESLIKFVTDRPGHDFRYSIDNTKIVNELNWIPKTNLNDGLIETINFYTEIEVKRENFRNNFSRW